MNDVTFAVIMSTDNPLLAWEKPQAYTVSELISERLNPDLCPVLEWLICECVWREETMLINVSLV